MSVIVQAHGGRFGLGFHRSNRLEGHDAPEPPSRYDGGARFSAPPDGSSNGTPGDGRNSQFDSTRRLVTASKIMAVVSLIIGGVLLSGAAFAVAISAFLRTRRMADDRREVHLPWHALKRSAVISVVISAFALVVNIVALVVFYPIAMDALQSGDYASLFANAPQSQPLGNGTSTWG